MIQFKEYYYDIKLVLVAVTITAIVVVPISVAVILPRTEVILSNLVVTLKVFDPDILRSKYSLYLTVPDVIGSKIVNKHNRLDHQSTKGGVTWQVFLASREGTLQTSHPPLTCLPKRHMHIRNEEEIVTRITMKSSCCSFCDWADKGTIGIPTSRETLVDTYFICEHPPLHLIQESRCQTPVGPAPRKIDRCKEYLTVRAISKHIIHHCVTIIPAIHCILVNTIVSALCWERNPIHETIYLSHGCKRMG